MPEALIRVTLYLTPYNPLQQLKAEAQAAQKTGHTGANTAEQKSLSNSWAFLFCGERV